MDLFGDGKIFVSSTDKLLIDNATRGAKSWTSYAASVLDTIYEKKLVHLSSAGMRGVPGIDKNLYNSLKGMQSYIFFFLKFPATVFILYVFIILYLFSVSCQTLYQAPVYDTEFNSGINKIISNRKRLRSKPESANKKCKCDAGKKGTRFLL